MREPQEPHSDVPYDRPSEKWTCGHANGERCLLGPTLGGRCRSGSDCAPRKAGDRWQCNRPSTRGGPCKEGPDPEGRCGCHTEKCSPVKSLRTKRAVFAFCCGAFTLGLMMYAMNSESRREILAPGPLTRQHAQILTKANAANRCGSCHEAGDKSMSHWMLQTVGVSTEPSPQSHPQTQTDLCLKCHDKNARCPYSFSRTRLAACKTREPFECEGVYARCGSR